MINLMPPSSEYELGLAQPFPGKTNKCVPLFEILIDCSQTTHTEYTHHLI